MTGRHTMAIGDEVELVRRVGRWPQGQRAQLVGGRDGLLLAVVDERYATDNSKHDVLAVEDDDVTVV